MSLLETPAFLAGLGPAFDNENPRPIAEIVASVSRTDLEKAEVLFNHARRKRLDLDMQINAAKETGAVSGPMVPSNLPPEAQQEIRQAYRQTVALHREASNREAEALAELKLEKSKYVGRLREALAERRAAAQSTVRAAISEILAAWEELDAIATAVSRAGLAPPPLRLHSAQVRDLLSRISKGVGAA